jgi:hypothetical protein
VTLQEGKYFRGLDVRLGEGNMVQPDIVNEFAEAVRSSSQRSFRGLQ